MCRRFFSRIVTRKKRQRSGAMRKDKGMLKGERRINKQSRVEKSVLSALSWRMVSVKKERWNRCDERSE